MPIYTTLKKDLQIRKFCLYGFLKNLKFFEPYLIIYLLSLNMSLFHIGILFSVRETVKYVFEIPSGILADQYGKKKELMLCFTFYIISFVLIFMGSNLGILILAMTFYGLGEAFRSGTHKAIILGYLDHKKWFQYKGFVYGRTRSYSLLGSSLSAFISIVLIFNLPDLRWLFLASTLPYVLDLILITTYPEFLDEKKNQIFNLKTFISLSKFQLKSIMKNTEFKKIMLSSASFDSVFKTIKDYIQPILAALLLSAGTGAIAQLNPEDSLKIYLGILYGFFYIFSSIASKNICHVTNKINPRLVYNRMYDLMGLLLVLLAFAIYKNILLLGIGIYFILYLLKDSRRPVFLDVSADYMTKDQRATSLSLESQLSALLMIIMAPLFGWIVDYFSFNTLFLIIGCSMLLLNHISDIKKK